MDLGDGKEGCGFLYEKYKVSNVKTVPGGVSLRVLAAEKPSENAVLDEATLEDVFLHYFGEKAGGEDA